MITRTIIFKKLSDVSLYEALNCVGIYVIWDSRSSVKPSYIGEGDVIKRLSDHQYIFAKPLDGYISFMVDNTKKRNKVDAQAIETLLLLIGEEKNRAPIHNAKPGHKNIIKNTCKKENILKVYIKGYDPFVHPSASRKIQGSKLIIAEYDEENDELILNCDWRIRS